MASNLDTKKRLALAIVDFLQTSLKDGTLQSEDSESIEIATSCIADTFHVDPSNESSMKEATSQQNLLQIYTLYEKLKAKPPASGPSQPTTSTSAPTTGSPSSTTEESENLKKQGNAAMQRKDHTGAIDFYSQALKISPTNPIYLSNRAAAYSGSGNHKDAATDAELAVAADPKYSKAWSRLGLARFVLGDARASMEAYEQGMKAEESSGGKPSDAMKKGYETAKRKVEEQEREGKDGGELQDEAVDEAAGAPRGGGGGMPDLASMMGGMGGGGGGMPDMAGMMNNPMFAQMAQSFMSDPDKMNNLLQNPQIRAMADRFGLGGTGGAGGSPGPGAGSGAGARGGAGGGGGMPDLASMMNDPSIQEMAKNFMGGRGGGGAGRGGP